MRTWIEFVSYCYVSEFQVAQLYLTLCDSMDYTIHGILQARKLEWVAFPFSRGIFPTQGSNQGHLHCRLILYQLSHKESPRILEWVTYPFTSGSSWPRNWTQVSCIAGRFFTELSGKYLVKCKRFQIQNNVSIFAEWVEVFCLIFIPFLFSLKCFFLFLAARS